MLALAFLPIHTANIVIMGICHCTALELSKMPRQKLFTLGWRSFLGVGTIIVAGLCAHQGSQYCDYSVTLTHSPVIIQDAWLEIGDTLLMLMSRICQQACHWPFNILSRPITPLWIDVTMQPFDCANDETKILDAPLTLTIETYQQSFGVQWYCTIFIEWLLTANIPFLCIITCIQKHSVLSVFKPPLFMSSVRSMT